MLVLASGSPRRRDLLAMLVDEFEIDVPEIDESTETDDPIAESVEVALRKARHVAARRPGATVLGADTTLAVDGHSLGQPSDRRQARELLVAASGRTCLVTTGLALLSSHRERAGAVSAQVRLRTLTPVEIDEYLSTDAWQGKAGALEVQGEAARFVDEVSGCLGSVIGLPVCEVAQLLDLDDPCADRDCVAGRYGRDHV